MNASVESTITVGSLIGGRWLVQRRLGKGGYGMVYAVDDIKGTGTYAMKVETRKRTLSKLRKETYILKKLANSTHACRYVDSGRHEQLEFLVMTKTGRDLHELRKKSKNKRFDIGTILQIGIQCVEALRDLHNIGFIHRDVKPSNFTIGVDSNGKQIIYMLDFGLAFQYGIPGKLCSYAGAPTFHGTLRYASFNAHGEKSLGMHDDLIALFYTLAELYRGQLPWSGNEGKYHLGLAKLKADVNEMFGDMPSEIVDIYKGLIHKSCRDPVDHSSIIATFTAVASKLEVPGTLNLEYDNQSEENNSVSTASLISEKPRKPPSKKPNWKKYLASLVASKKSHRSQK
ncbi:Tau tubulin kinase 1 [Trichuris trichiura]|uniref:non-specific serine/threonine protein kinase n=1 Tax=Trichuris trichiura TaxID=36087 RepID=A0A077Z8Q5_TRITR|nr:Tau tubulin kinase 1 [Trichuris trichiura]